MENAAVELSKTLSRTYINMYFSIAEGDAGKAKWLSMHVVSMTKELHGWEPTSYSWREKP